MSYLARVRARLAELDAQTLRRAIALPGAAIDFSSNDYLGMAREPSVVAALRAADRVGSGGARLLGGAHPEHADLEAALAAWTGRERALLFSSGYLAVMGAIVGLARTVDAAYSDERNHACAIDGLRLCRLPRTIFPHRALPPRAERAANAMIVSETRFGMDGTRADLAAMLASLGSGDVLVLDEAHALGVDGERGAGEAAVFDDPRIVVIGTLSKALGGLGGFVAGPADAIDLLTTDARTFMFDTALPPALASAMSASVASVRGSDGDARRARLRANAKRVRDGVRALGLGGDGDGPVIPVIVGDAAVALAMARDLAAQGIIAPAIRPPTVPAGSARLRITVRADHSDDDLTALLDALERSLAPAR